jgi:hypothetical protein
MKVKSKKSLKNKADILWSKIIRINGYCEWCGQSYGKLDAHHIMGKKGILRYELRNGVCLCYKHHRLKAHSDSAEDVKEYLEWVKVYKAADWDYLSSLKRERIVSNSEYYEGIIKGLKEALEYYQSEN